MRVKNGKTIRNLSVRSFRDGGKAQSDRSGGHCPDHGFVYFAFYHCDVLK